MNSIPFTAQVILGTQRSRTLGFPTANCMVGVLPCASGTYAAQVLAPNGQTYRAVWPYFAERNLLELHLLGFAWSLEGQIISGQLIQCLRPNQVFASLDDLVVQIRHDIAQTEAMGNEFYS